MVVSICWLVMKAWGGGGVSESNLTCLIQDGEAISWGAHHHHRKYRLGADHKLRLFTLSLKWHWKLNVEKPSGFVTLGHVFTM